MYLLGITGQGQSKLLEELQIRKELAADRRGDTKSRENYRIIAAFTEDRLSALASSLFYRTGGLNRPSVHSGSIRVRHKLRGRFSGPTAGEF